jgi:GT2 family glycosyltransferase
MAEERQPVLASVIVPARNAALWLGCQLQALSGQDYTGRWEVVVVDDASEDETSITAQRWNGSLPSLTVVRAALRGGPSRARNLGSNAASGSLLLFCDADDEVGPEWVKAMVEALGSSDAVGGAIDDVRLNASAVRTWRAPFTSQGLPIGWWFLPYAPSGNMGVRSEAFEAVGGFDGRFWACEDMDLSWRLQLAGYRLGYSEAAVVAYRHRPTMVGMAQQAFRYGVGGSQVRYRFERKGERRPIARTPVERMARILKTASTAWQSYASRGALVRALAFEAGTLWGTVDARCNPSWRARP